MSSMTMSMEMSTTSSMSMAMSTTSSMSMAMSTTSSMSMAMSTTMSMDSSSTSSSDMDMDMDMDSSMSMNYYLTSSYSSYPLLFEKLTASNNGQAFGIFLLIMAAGFVYKFLTFLSWYLDLIWFKESKREEAATQERGEHYTIEDLELQRSMLPTGFSRMMFTIFAPSWKEFAHDFVRLIIAFVYTLLIYMLMLAAMSFVLTYVFAVVLGLSLAGVLFNRIKLNLLQRWEIEREIEKRLQVCSCGPVSNKEADFKSSSSQGSSSDINNPPEKIGCCCGNDGHSEEFEQKILAVSNQVEQVAGMDDEALTSEKIV